MIKNILVFIFIFLSINLSYAQPPASERKYFQEFEEIFTEEGVNNLYYQLGLNHVYYNRSEHERMYNSFVKTFTNYIKYMQNNKPEGLFGKKLLCSYNDGRFLNDSGELEITEEEHGLIFIPKSTVHGDIADTRGNLAAIIYTAQKPDVNLYKFPDAWGPYDQGIFFGVTAKPIAVTLEEKKIIIQLSSNSELQIDRETLSYTNVPFPGGRKKTYGKCELYKENMTNYFFSKESAILNRNIKHYQKKKEEQGKNNKI